MPLWLATARYLRRSWQARPHREIASIRYQSFSGEELKCPQPTQILEKLGGAFLDEPSEMLPIFSAQINAYASLLWLARSNSSHMKPSKSLPCQNNFLSQISPLRLGFPVSMKQGTQYKITRCLLIYKLFILTDKKVLKLLFENPDLLSI